MSVAWSRYIRENVDPRKLSPAARHLLEVLGHYGNADGVAYPSTTTLMARMCASKSTVKRARREIVTSGVLVVVPGQGRRPTVYNLPPAALRGVTGEPSEGSLVSPRGVTGDPRSTNRRSKEGARTWCDGSCVVCHGVGWIEQRAANGRDPTNVAEPCPNRL